MYHISHPVVQVRPTHFHKANNTLKSLFLGSVAMIMLITSPMSQSFADDKKPVLTAVQMEKAKKEKALLIAKAKNEAAIKKADNALLKIQTKLAEISLSKKELETQKSSLQNLLKYNNEISNLPEWIQSPIFKGLFSKQYRLRNEFETAKISLLPAHPRYKRLKARTTALNKEIYKELSKIKIRLKQDIASSTKEETKLKASLTNLQTKVAAAKKDRYKLQTLSNMAELSLVSAQKISLEERTRLLDTALEKYGQNLLTSEPNTSPRLVQLLDQYTDMSMTLAELSTKWSVRHPRIKQVQQHLNLLQDQIAKLARKEILDMDLIAQSLSAKEEDLHKKAEAFEIEQEERTVALELKKEKANIKKAAVVSQAPQPVAVEAKKEALDPTKPLSLAYERRTSQVQVDTTSLMRSSH